MRLRNLLAGVTLAALVCSGSRAGAEITGQQRAEAVGRGLIGKSAPAFVLKTIDGDTIDLGRLYGKRAVYLKFWATWCVPCREQMPHFEHVYETRGSDLEVIAVNVGFDDSIDAVERYRRTVGITMPIVFDDGRLDSAFHVRVTPQSVVIGKDGRIEYVGNLADQRLDAALLDARRAVASDSDKVRADGAAPSAERAFDVGDRLPRHTVTTIDGRSMRIYDRHSRVPTVLVFLSPWCESYLASSRPAISASCRSVRERINARAANRRVRWLGVASGIWAESEDLREYRAKYHLRIPLTLDKSGVLFRTFRVTGVPTILVANERGTIVRRVDWNDPQALRTAFDGL